MQKADYHKIAENFDKGRPLSGQITDAWLDVVSRLSKAPRGAKVLDIGCGTGRFALPLAEKLGFKVTGADLFKEMLAKAQEKDTSHLVTWEVQDAQSLTYPDSTFDVVFMSHLLHHCDDPDKVLRECYRVLKAPGVVLVRYGALEQIEHDAEHTFFPEALAIDKARVFTFARMDTCLKQAGFTKLKPETITQRYYATGYDYLKVATLKGDSVLTMIFPAAFEKGLGKLREYVAGHPNDPWLLDSSMTLTAGYKGKK
jgi:ubiquinone/menaquinone biosynthesis C-methylase UbiE